MFGNQGSETLAGKVKSMQLTMFARPLGMQVLLPNNRFSQHYGKLQIETVYRYQGRRDTSFDNLFSNTHEAPIARTTPLRPHPWEVHATALGVHTDCWFWFRTRGRLPSLTSQFIAARCVPSYASRAEDVRLVEGQGLTGLGVHLPSDNRSKTSAHTCSLGFPQTGRARQCGAAARRQVDRRTSSPYSDTCLNTTVTLSVSCSY